MAAGEGRRLRPFTERWPKPILPIDGRPVIATLLRELAAAGVERAFVVTGHLAEQVEALVGDGAAFALPVVYARQPGVLGSADAVARGLAAGAEPPVLITAADTAYAPGAVHHFVAAFAASDAAGAIATRRGLVPSREKPAVRVEGARVVAMTDYDEALPFTSAPLWALAPPLAPYLEGLSGPPYELADAYQRAVDDGLEIAAIEIPPTRDLTHPLDLVQRNFPYLEAYERDLPPVQEGS
jgi:CTP:molybdopterin cytidylyltransferase MocA